VLQILRNREGGKQENEKPQTKPNQTKSYRIQAKIPKSEKLLQKNLYNVFG